MKNIEKIIFQEFFTKKHLFIFPFCFTGYCNILIQVDENKKENKIYYFGNFLKKNKFIEIEKEIRNISDNKDIFFLYHK